MHPHIWISTNLQAYTRNYTPPYIYTTFYRHLNDKSSTVCPGKKRTGNHEESSDGESNIPKVFQEGSSELIVDVDSSEKSDICYDADPEQLSPILSRSNSAFFILSSCESVSKCSLSSDEDIWDISDEDEQSGECVDNSVKQTLSAISIFLVFYHLAYRVSERAMTMLISYLHALFHFLSVVTGHALLIGLAHTFPKTLHVSRSQHVDKMFTEYVVCEECVISDNDNCESKHCLFTIPIVPGRVLAMKS